jgi:hypothetical protein
MLVRVETDSVPKLQLARVIRETDDKLTIQFLSATDEQENGRTVYAYEEDTYDIDDDYVAQYLDDEEEAGFRQVPSGWIRKSNDDDDADYEPSCDEVDDDDDDMDEEADDADDDYDVEDYED